MTVDKKLDWVNIAFLAFAHVVAIVGAVLYVALHGLTLAALVLFVLWFAACGFSVTAGYHRLFAHATYRTHPLVRTFYLFFGAAAIENSALKWSSDHRRHHAYTDADPDPYNIKKGFWWAHIGWVFHKDDLPIENVGDLERDPFVRLQHHAYVPLAIFAGFVLPFSLGALLGDAWGGLILAGFVRLVVLYHSTFFVNSVAHALGRQPYSDANSSRDSALTALLTLGEGYHNFHHTFPFDYRNGALAWQYDPTKWLIRILNLTGLARDLVRTPQDVVIKARLRMDEKRAAAWLKDHPVWAEQLRLAREQLEHLVDRWVALKAELAALKARTEDYSHEAIARLKREIREARSTWREAYAAWHALRSMPVPVASIQ